MRHDHLIWWSSQAPLSMRSLPSFAAPIVVMPADRLPSAAISTAPVLDQTLTANRTVVLTRLRAVTEGAHHLRMGHLGPPDPAQPYAASVALSTGGAGSSAS